MRRHPGQRRLIERRGAPSGKRCAVCRWSGQTAMPDGTSSGHTEISRISRMLPARTGQARGGPISKQRVEGLLRRPAIRHPQGERFEMLPHGRHTGHRCGESNGGAPWGIARRAGRAGPAGKPAPALLSRPLSLTGPWTVRRHNRRCRLIPHGVNEAKSPKSCAHLLARCRRSCVAAGSRSSRAQPSRVVCPRCRHTVAQVAGPPIGPFRDRMSEERTPGQG